MKYYKTLKQYKASNLVYDEIARKAFSYEWYQLARQFGDTMIVNTYRYSPSTQRHAYKIRQLFDLLGIQYITLDAPDGLQSLESAREFYRDKIASIQALINKPRSRKDTNFYREMEITHLTKQLLIVDALEYKQARV